MDPFETKKAELDKQLEGAPQNVGIAFGTELFNEFRKRGWFTLEVFGALGTTLFAGQVPTYKKTHFAFLSWGIKEREFEVGKSQ
jgi:hypothetical protein